MSQDECLAYLRAFGPLSLEELCKAGMSLGSVNSCLARLKKHKDVWSMQGLGRRGGRSLWGAV